MVSFQHVIKTLKINEISYILFIMSKSNVCFILLTPTRHVASAHQPYVARDSHMEQGSSGSYLY